MRYILSYDREMQTFQPLTVRSRLLLGGQPVRLKREAQVEVAAGSPYAGKANIRNAELFEGGMAHRFVVELAERFTLQEWRGLVLAKRPLSLRVTLYPDIAMAVPTAGIPIPTASPAISEAVEIDMPDAAIGRIEAMLDPDLPTSEQGVYLRARVCLPQVIANRAPLEQQHTLACRFTSQSEFLAVAGTAPAGDWIRAHLTLAPGQIPTAGKPVTAPVLVTADIENIRLERQILVTVHRARSLELVLSSDRVRTTLREPASLTVRAMEVWEDDSRTPAEDAEISITLVRGPAEVLSVALQSGRGELTATITQTALSGASSGELGIEARVDEGSVKARVPLQLAAGAYALKLEPVDLAEAPWGIRWDGEQRLWQCDTVKLQLVRRSDGEETPEPIEQVELEDGAGWLEIERLYNDRDGMGAMVRLRIKPGREEGLVPDATGVPSWEVLGALPEPQAPWKVLTTLATFHARGASTGASASAQAEFWVEPPRFHWSVRQSEPLRLSGAAEGVDLHVESRDLPPGWEQGLRALVVFADAPAAGRMGLALQAQAVAPGEEDADVTRLRGTLRAEGGALCLRIVREAPEEPAPEAVGLHIALRGDYYGVTDGQRVDLSVQPQLAALYLDGYPHEDYPWSEPKCRVQVIRPDQAAPSQWSRLPVSLKHLSGDGWPVPPVRWQLADEGAGDGLDDRFAGAQAADAEYTAPRQDAWLECGRPSQRTILCRIGNGQEAECVDEGSYPDLYLTAVIPTTLTLAQALGKIKLRVGARPKGFPGAADGLELGDAALYDAFSRSFVLEVDLQKLPLNRRER